MLTEAIAKILKEKPKNMVTEAINKVLSKHGQPAEGLNTLLDSANRGSKILTIALDNGKLVELLNSNIDGNLNDNQVKALANFTLQGRGGSFEAFMQCRKMEGKELKTNATMQGNDDVALVGTALAHKQIKEFLQFAEHLTLDEFLSSSMLAIREDGALINKEIGEDVEVPQEEFKTFLELALINLKPDAMQDFSLQTSAKYGQPNFGNGITLYDELVIYAKAVGQLEHLWYSYTSPDQQKGLAAAALEMGNFVEYLKSQQEIELPINSTIIKNGHPVSLFHLALAHSNFTEFLEISAGKLNYMAEIQVGNGMAAPAILLLLGNNQFEVFAKSNHNNGIIDIGSEYGAQIISLCIKHGGKAQWESLVKSSKLVGMLEDFNSLVPHDNHEAPLVFVLAQHNMLNEVLSYLAEKGQLEFNPDIEGDGTDLDKSVIKHYKNELDLGEKKWPGRAIKEAFKIGDGEAEFVTPLFMYQVPTESSLIPNMVAQGKLVINLSGDVFGKAVDYMLETDFVKSGKAWFEAVIYTHQAGPAEGQEMLEIAALVSGGSKESKYSGKLVYGCMPQNIKEGCEKACRESVFKDPKTDSDMSADPWSESTFYWLKPFLASDATAVTKEYLMEHHVSEEAADILLGKPYESGEMVAYWE